MISKFPKLEAYNTLKVKEEILILAPQLPFDFFKKSGQKWGLKPRYVSNYKEEAA